MDLNTRSNEIHAYNVAKGFYDDKTEIGTKLMLVVSEVAEAMEADRHEKKANLGQFNILMDSGHYTFEDAFKSTIKDSFEDEIADSIIRLLDLSGFMKIDIETHVNLKLAYNKTRPVRHGKKY